MEGEEGSRIGTSPQPVESDATSGTQCQIGVEFSHTLLVSKNRLVLCGSLSSTRHAQHTCWNWAQEPKRGILHLSYPYRKNDF